MGVSVNEGALIKNYIFGELFASIVRNEYTISSIITEKELIEKFGYSRSPVREALQELCNDGILESLPRHGYRIKHVSVKDMLDAMDFRIIIEVSALEKTMKHITPEDIEKLEEAVRSVADIKEMRDPYIHWETNTKFHLLLCSFSGNKYFVDTLKHLMRCCFRGVTTFFEFSFEHDLNREDGSAHAKLVELIKSGDFEAAKKALISDIEDFKSSLAANIGLYY